jgi:hypothetical protein
LPEKKDGRKKQWFECGNISTPPSEVKPISARQETAGNMLEEIVVLHHSTPATGRMPRIRRETLSVNDAMTANKKQSTTYPDEPYNRFFF